MRGEASTDRKMDFSLSPGSLAGPRDLGPLGADPSGTGTFFRVWAPRASSLHLVREDPEARAEYPMEREEGGYFSLFLEGALPGTTYRYLIDGTTLRPDPASRLQREGVHGPSTVWGAPEASPVPFAGHALRDLVFYELHVGTFAPSSDFDGILPFLDHLVRTGVTALELMPVSQFPGRRNWGYDGVFPFAVQSSYGGPEGLFRLVREAHLRGLSVFLDVVCNHLGPEGNYLSDFGPYFSRTTRTPWGEALNFDGPESDHVRHFFLENLRTLSLLFDLDGFRFDAIHAIRDQSPHPFLADVARLAANIAARRGRPLHLVAESNANDRRTVLPVEDGGLGFDSQWSDDFHHALHVAFTGERTGYYEDFSGTGDLVQALAKGFVYRGQHAPAFRCRRGSASEDLPGKSFVFFAQNHDQTGNRMQGERLAALLPPEALPAIAALVLLSPGLPLLFMGEEYGETRPFLYFTDHGDPDLISAVRKGRKEEFAAFSWSGEVPDPQDPLTFERSRLVLSDTGVTLSPFQKDLLRWTARLAGIRKSFPALSPPDPIGGPRNRVFSPADGVMVSLRSDASSRILILVNLTDTSRALPASRLFQEGEEESREVLLDSAAFFGTRPPLSLSSGRPEVRLGPFHALLLSGRGS
ncbi:MAG: malto-oligosyltrehalose trehalohydrolase [Nitrospirae bacterium]|nr:malto-oligosyltrehalose trehalohydrolase [Nitrospirota bacterium]